MSDDPINVWDLRLRPGGAIRLPVPEGHTALLAYSGSRAAGFAPQYANLIQSYSAT